MTAKRPRVAIAMSGGVDSSLAARLLVEQGYEAMGVTIKLWGYPDAHGEPTHESNCCSLEDINNARAECDALGIPHQVMDMSATFKQIVVENFVAEYRAGRTPNPCVICNTEIKWHALLNELDRLGVDLLATGHYARKVRHAASGQWVVGKGQDRHKDQSYFLWGIRPEDLARTLFPLGELSKQEVREQASRARMRTAQSPESMEVCFVPDNDYRRFLQDQYPEVVATARPGHFVDAEGRIIGEHQGLYRYTIGQRKGLGLATGERVFINRIDPETNTIQVGNRDAMAAYRFTVTDTNWLIPPGQVWGTQLDVQIRYNHQPQPARIEPRENDQAVITFLQPEYAITPGQSAVFFQNELVIGGGIISSVGDV